MIYSIFEVLTPKSKRIQLPTGISAFIESFVAKFTENYINQADDFPAFSITLKKSPFKENIGRIVFENLRII
jgi:hypothetical protein